MTLTPRSNEFFAAHNQGKKAIQQDIMTAALIRSQRIFAALIRSQRIFDIPLMSRLQRDFWNMAALATMEVELSSQGLTSSECREMSVITKEQMDDMLLSLGLQKERRKQEEAARFVTQAQQILAGRDADLGKPTESQDLDTGIDDGPPRRHIIEGGENQFGQMKPGFKEEHFVAAELMLVSPWQLKKQVQAPGASAIDRIEQFLDAIGAPPWPYSFESAWENWRRAHGKD